MGKATLLSRFESRYEPEPTTGCWLWTGALTSAGYGMLKDNGRILVASRVAWELHRGPIPSGMYVLHHCDTRSCVNWETHLFLGTKGDNNRDCAAKGRYPEQRRTHCPRGHAYSPENTYLWRTQRFCRQCARERRGATGRT